MSGAGITLAMVAVTGVLVAGAFALRAAPTGASAGDVYDGPRVVRIVDPDTFDIEVGGALGARRIERIRPTLLDGVERGHRDFDRGRKVLDAVLRQSRALRVEVVKLDRWSWGPDRRPRLIARVTARFPAIEHLNPHARVPLGVAVVGLAMMDGEARRRPPFAIPYVSRLRDAWKGVER